ncbi:MAG TPA: GNAT family N-acetyltransferase [Ktedonobacteraceae bacterium]|nr:GNAT family N-acetyltransferase [Ktedonobacteraceae bacterium]
MNSEITIRHACQEDSAAIDTILRSVGWFERINKEAATHTQSQIMQRLLQCKREGTHTILVAEYPRGTVVGYIAVHWFPVLMRGLDGYVSELFVQQSAAGKGIGSRLLDAVNEEARRRGCTRLILMNRRDRESYQRGFYAQNGWEELREGAFFALLLPEESKSA